MTGTPNVSPEVEAERKRLELLSIDSTIAGMQKNIEIIDSFITNAQNLIPQKPVDVAAKLLAKIDMALQEKARIQSRILELQSRRNTLTTS